MIRFLRGYVSILRVSIVHAFEYCSRRWSNVLFFLKWMRAFSSSFKVVFALFLRRKFYKRRGRFCAHLRFAFSLAPSGPRKNCARKKKNGRKRVRFMRWCRFITRVRFAPTQTVRWWRFLRVIFFLRERVFLGPSFLGMKRYDAIFVLKTHLFFLFVFFSNYSSTSRTQPLAAKRRLKSRMKTSSACFTTSASPPKSKPIR